MSKTTEDIAAEAAATMQDAILAIELFAESRTPLAGKIREAAIASLKGHAQTLRQVGGTPQLDGSSTADLVDRPLDMRVVSR